MSSHWEVVANVLESTNPNKRKQEMHNIGIIILASTAVTVEVVWLLQQEGFGSK